LGTKLTQGGGGEWDGATGPLRPEHASSAKIRPRKKKFKVKREKKPPEVTEPYGEKRDGKAKNTRG